MKKTPVPLSVLPAIPVVFGHLPKVPSMTDARSPSFTHPAAQVASAALPLTDVLLALWTVESGLSVQYEFRLDGMLLMVTRTAGADVTTFCAQQDLAAFRLFVRQALSTLKGLRLARGRALRGMPVCRETLDPSGYDPDESYWDDECINPELCRRYWLLLGSAGFPEGSMGFIERFDPGYSPKGWTVPATAGYLAAALSTAVGRQELLYAAGIIYLRVIISKLGDVSLAAHRRLGLPCGALSYSARYLMASLHLHAGHRDRVFTEAALVDALLWASWPELVSLPSPERYVRHGVPLAAKITARHTRGFSRPLREAFHRRARQESARRSLAWLIRQARQLVPDEEIVKVLDRNGRLASPLTPIVHRRIPGACLEFHGLVDLRAVTMELATHEWVGELIETDLPVRFWLTKGFVENGPEVQLNNLRFFLSQKLLSSSFGFGGRVEALYRDRCSQLGISPDPVSDQPFALLPDAWNQDLTIANGEGTETFLFRTCVSEADLLKESDEMIHCVGRGSYTAAAMSGAAPIVSVRAAGDPERTLAFTVELTARGQVLQARGKRNENLGACQSLALETWLSQAVRVSGAQPTAPREEWQSVRAQQLSDTSGQQKLARQQAEARLWAYAQVEPGFDMEAYRANERLLRQRLMSFIAEIDRVALQALRGAQQLLKTQQGLRVRDWVLEGQGEVMSEETRWRNAAAVLYDSPYGPVLSLVERNTSLKLLGGPVGRWVTQSATRVSGGGLRRTTRGVGGVAEQRQVTHRSCSFRDCPSLTETESALAKVMLGTDLHGNLVGLLRPSRLPRRASERQVLMDAWSAKKEALGITVSERGALVVRGVELRFSERRSALTLSDFATQAQLDEGSFEALLRGEGPGFELIASQLAQPGDPQAPAFVDPAFDPLLPARAMAWAD